MFENNRDEIEMGAGEVTEEDALLYSSYVGPRMFVQNDLDRTRMWGVLLEESDDSFLVGLPATFEPDADGELVAKPVEPVPYIRLQKSAILYTTYLSGAYQDLYMEYIDSKGRELYPEVMDYIEEGTEIEPSDLAEAAVATPESTDIGLSKDAPNKGEVLGMTDDELKKYLTEKFNNGELANGSRKKQ